MRVEPEPIRVYRHGMGAPSPASNIQIALAMARAILSSRPMRRRLLFRCTLFLLAMLGIGVLTLGQIPRHPWVMLVFWLGVAAFTIGVFLFALYDLLAVRREGRKE